MVRLKATTTSPTLTSKCHFNSNMVRLKVLIKVFATLPTVFQFQYGSIKREDVRDIEEFVGDFNSNMVRLKVSVSLLKRFLVSIFQFQYGSIKSLASERIFCDSLIFQFQYGSIKSNPIRNIPL